MTLILDAPVDLAPDVVDDATRREFVAGGLSLGALLLAGCGDDRDGSPASAGDEDDFPVSVRHKYGSTTIPRKPERVVTLGLTDHDTVLALGTVPVALVDWFGDQPRGVWPWARESLGNATPIRLSSEEINFEQVAAARPDLILAIHTGLKRTEYETLSRLAPTVAQSGRHVDFGTPWQEQTRTIARALGRTDRGNELIGRVERTFDATVKANPRFDGATAVIAITGEPGTYFPYGPQDGRARFLSDLGFEFKPEIARLAGDAFFATISTERLDLLNADVLIWIVNSDEEAEALRTNPIYRAQPVVERGRDIFLPVNEPLAGALSYNNALSLPVAVDRLVPLLSAALDGDPATRVPARP